MMRDVDDVSTARRNQHGRPGRFGAQAEGNAKRTRNGREPGRVLMLLGNCAYPRDNRVRREASGLVEAGYRVAVVAPALADEPLRETFEGVEVFRYPDVVRGGGPAAYVLEYAYRTGASLVLSTRASLGARTEVIHAHNPPDTFVLIGLLFKLLGRRFVYDHHDLAPELFLSRFPRAGRAGLLVYRALALLERLSCRLADAVITTNESYRKVEMERSGIPPEKITVVRNGPQPEKLLIEEADPELRARAPFILGFIGVMGHADGVDYLIRAVHNLVHELGRDDIHCVLVGEGDAVPDLQKLAVSLGIDRHIEFAGRLSDRDARRVLCTADVCIVPDPSNTFNDLSTMTKMMDYMALGRPIVAFDLPEHRRTAGDAAVYVRDNDELELAKAIAALLDDPKRRRELGALARKRVQEQLAWEHSLRDLLAVYHGLLGPARGQAAATSNDRR
jgi:glycosyltransferase involved in cell wall biosynthesis